MALAEKTVAFAFPRLASIANNTLTNFGQITIELNESNKTFRNAYVEFSCNDIITATGGTLTTKNCGMRLGASAYTSITNTQTLTNSGENLSLFFTQDFTSLFTASWSGNSMTCDFQVQINQSTGTTLGMVDGSAILYITYTFEETSEMQTKTVFIPFDSLVGALPTTKTAFATVPALNAFCAEAVKTFLNCALIIEGNENVAASTTDFTISFEFDSDGAVVSGNHELALATDRFVRQVDNVTSFMTPASTRVLNLWASQARMFHCSVTLMVTYKYSSSTSTRMTVSCILPLEIDSPFGGTTTNDAQRAERTFFIPEPGTITTLNSAFRLFWTQNASMGILYARAGTQSYKAYTPTAAVTAGGMCLQRTIEDNITLVRGKNTINIDAYRNGTSVLGWSTCALVIINYQCDVPSGGPTRANRTLNVLLRGMSTTGTAANIEIPNTVYPGNPMDQYQFFINALGNEIWTMTSGTGTYMGLNALVERLTAEGGPKWEQILLDAARTDPEVGRCTSISQTRSLFKRFTGDDFSGRMESSNKRRRFNTIGALAIYWMKIATYITYHTVNYAVNGNITGSDGGTITLELIRDGEKVKETSRVGDGSYSFTWFPDGTNLFVAASESAKHGKSANNEAL